MLLVIEAIAELGDSDFLCERRYQIYAFPLDKIYKKGRKRYYDGNSNMYFRVPDMDPLFPLLSEETYFGKRAVWDCNLDLFEKRQCHVDTLGKGIVMSDVYYAQKDADKVELYKHALVEAKLLEYTYPTPPSSKKEQRTCDYLSTDPFGKDDDLPF